MNISLLYPTARPHLCAAVIDNWLKNATHPEKIKVVLAYDRDRHRQVMEQKFSPLALSTSGICFTLQQRFPCIVNTLNAAAAEAQGDLFVCIADDLEPCQEWDLLLGFIANPAVQQVIHVNDGSGSKETRIPIITKKRYDRYGYILYPEYWSNYSDDDFYQCAQLDGVIVDASHITFKHAHKGADHDEIYRLTNSPEYTIHNLAVYNWRKATNFGLYT